jgi:hypothetical protein
MSLVANPDFEKIAGNGFTQYEYEPFTTTLEQYGLSDAFTLWQQGADEHLFHAEFHGREHLNVKVWMDALRHGDPHTRAAFDQGCWGFRPAGLASINFQAAFDLDRPEDVEVQKEIITDGLYSFEQLHGYRATYMVPPNGPFSDLLEPAAASAGIKYLATAKIHKSLLGNGKHRKGFCYLGKKNQHQQVYLIRNCFFEPSLQPEKDWVGLALKRIEKAFQKNHPAIVESHRINFITTLQEKNRTTNLALLGELLTKVLEKWPDVEFVTTEKLGEIINVESN